MDSALDESRLVTQLDNGCMELVAVRDLRIIRDRELICFEIDLDVLDTG
ncbi:MAG: hypothetical protein O7C67_01740 [Gammaproteobacteria bacterium]|nr:hypothetical protein [Gammaproteobacteria bacterium]